MKRSIENVTKSDDTSQPAKIANQQSRSDALRSSSDTPEHLESASNTKNSLATSFVQQDSVLTAEQIESLLDFDKDEVKTVLEKIALDAKKGYPDALNAISRQLANFTKEELEGIFQRSPHALKNIADAACKGHPVALNAVSRQLGNFTKDELKGIFQRSSHTLIAIATAACKGHPVALNAISQELAKFDKDELNAIFQRSPNTLGHIAIAAYNGSPDALNAISEELKKFDKEELKAIFQNSPQTLNAIAAAACKGHPNALNAVSGQLGNFTKDELNAIFQRSPHTLDHIATVACKGHPNALNAISEELKKFDKGELKAIFQRSPHTLGHIAIAAYNGSPDALSAVFSPLDGITGYSPGVVDYITYLNRLMKRLLTSFKHRSRFLGLERAFCNLDETTFSRITNGASSKIISQLEKSINWYKEFSVIFNQSSSDQADMSQAEFQVQENRSVRLCRFINDNVLQRDRDQTSREFRIDFVNGLCDYLTVMGHHHIVMDLSKICRTYRSGLNGYDSPGYADSVLHEFSRTLAQSSVTSFFQESPASLASPESDSERDKRYEKAYDMLKSFNANLGLWIQFVRGRDPLSAQKTVVEHFKVFLRAYLNLNSLGDRTIDNDIDYDDVNKVLKEKDWDAFVVCRDRFFVNELADTATSSGSFQPFSLGS